MWLACLVFLVWTTEIDALAVPSQTRAVSPLTVGTQDLDWKSIGFEFRSTRSFMHYKYRDGQWDSGTEMDGAEPYIPVHIGATALHYGQSLFEGLKAFACEDGQVRLFRPYENAKRMRRGAERTLMVPPPEDLFVDACKQAVKANLDYVPPYNNHQRLFFIFFSFGEVASLSLV